jgi:D-glycero-D-manno-heptose 1,7-bisphosphate phosphatase
MKNAKAVFLDRDGVLNRTLFWREKWRAPRELAELEILPGVEQAVKDLRAGGYLLVGVTNQPDVARGWQTRDRVDAINDAIRIQLGLDELNACFHTELEGCRCRKPEPGMLLEAAARLGIDLARSYIVGDRLTDVEAGYRAGCPGILVASPGYGDEADMAEPLARVESLLEASRIILRT